MQKAIWRNNMQPFNPLLVAALISLQTTAWAVEPTPASAETASSETAATTKKPAWEVKEVPASKQWVSDKLEVPLRSCPGDRCKVVKIV
jgi:hypothetical protein